MISGLKTSSLFAFLTTQAVAGTFPANLYSPNTLLKKFFEKYKNSAEINRPKMFLLWSDDRCKAYNFQDFQFSNGTVTGVSKEIIFCLTRNIDGDITHDQFSIQIDQKNDQSFFISYSGDRHTLEQYLKFDLPMPEGRSFWDLTFGFSSLRFEYRKNDQNWSYWGGYGQGKVRVSIDQYLVGEKLQRRYARENEADQGGNNFQFYVDLDEYGYPLYTLYPGTDPIAPYKINKWLENGLFALHENGGNFTFNVMTSRGWPGI